MNNILKYVGASALLAPILISCQTETSKNNIKLVSICPPNLPENSGFVCAPPAMCRWYDKVKPAIPAITWLFDSDPQVVADLTDAVKRECTQ